ncbi:MAG: hypothetical protein LBQ33_01830 [Oscillospiraceae bacterium]|jgi:hypothetical protein|nr:hypothetical protein [Oscillospiraceae bacterium]
MKKATGILAVLLTAALVFAGCGLFAPKPQELIAGKWQAAVGSLEFQAMEFIPNENADLTGTVKLGLLSNLVSGSYAITPAKEKEEKDQISITYQLFLISTTREYTFTVTDTALVLQADNSGVALNYTRAGVASTAATTE